MHDLWQDCIIVVLSVAPTEYGLQGETRRAVATLQRLGEDTRTSLKQLLFGTTRRSLRLQIVEEMESCGFLGPFDWKILERLSLIEVIWM